MATFAKCETAGNGGQHRDGKTRDTEGGKVRGRMLRQDTESTVKNGRALQEGAGRGSGDHSNGMLAKKPAQ